MATDQPRTPAETEADLLEEAIADNGPGAARERYLERTYGADYPLGISYEDIEEDLRLTREQAAQRGQAGIEAG